MRDPEVRPGNPPRKRRRRLLVVALLLVVLTPLALGLTLFWRLSRGPVSLNRFRSAIESRVSAAIEPLGLRLEGVSAAWRGWPEPLGVEIHGLTIVGPDGVEVLKLARATLALSQPDLLRGRVVPLALELENVRIFLLRTRDGRIGIGLDAPPEAADDRGLAWIEESFDPAVADAALGRLSSLRIRDASLFLEDRLLDHTWTLEHVEGSLDRISSGLQARISGEVRLDRAIGRLTADASYTLGERELTLRVDLSTDAGRVVVRSEPIGEPGVSRIRLQLHDLLPWKISAIEPLELLAALRIPVDGEVAIELVGRQPRSVVLALRGASGSVGPFPTFNERLEIDGFELQGSLLDGLHRLELTRGLIRFDGSALTFDGKARESAGAWSGDLNVRLDRLAVERLQHYWPAGVAREARDWVTQRITEGTVRDARLELAGSLDEDGEFSISNTTGSFGFLGLSVAALAPQPPFLQVEGRGFLDGGRLEFAVRRAELDRLQVGAGSVVLTGLEGDDPRLELDLPVHGPLASMLGLILEEPIGLEIEDFPDADAFDGTASARLELRLPLDVDVDPATIELTVTAQIRDGALEWSAPALRLDDADLTLSLTPSKLTLTGELQAQGTPLRINFEEQFDADGTFRRLHAEGRVDAEQLLAAALPEQQYVRGLIGLRIGYTETREGVRTAGLRCDLTEAAIRFDELDWSKSKGETGSIRLTAISGSGGIWSISPIDVHSRDLEARGSIKFTTQPPELLELEVEHLAWEENRLRGSMHRATDGGWQIAVEGETLDVGPFLAGGKAVHSTESRPPLELSLTLDRLGAGDRWLEEVAGRAVWDGLSWSEFEVEVGGDPEGGFRLSFLPGETGRELRVDCADLGGLLKTLDMTDKMEGGALEIRGSRESPDGPIHGHAELDQARLKDLSAAARLMRLASVQGALSSLESDGLKVQRIQTDFRILDKKIEILRGRVYADGIGITADGHLDLGERSVELRGSVAAAATLQRVLGEIPLLGPVLTGTKRGGLFASLYEVSGPLEDPSVDVKPRSLLTPGILRELFEPSPQRHE